MLRGSQKRSNQGVSQLRHQGHQQPLHQEEACRRTTKSRWPCLILLPLPILIQILYPNLNANLKASICLIPIPTRSRWLCHTPKLCRWPRCRWWRVRGRVGKSLFTLFHLKNVGRLALLLCWQVLPLRSPVSPSPPPWQTSPTSPSPLRGWPRWYILYTNSGR